MTIQFTQLTSGVQANTVSPDTTPTLSPTPGALVIVVGAFSGGKVGTGPMTVSTTVPGLTLTQVAQAAPAAATSEVGAVFVGQMPAGGGSGTFTITAGGSITSDAIFVWQVTGFDTTTPTVGAVFAISDTTGSMQLNVSQAPATGDWLVGCFFSRNIGSPAVPGAGFTQIANNAIPSPNAGLSVQYKTGTTQTLVDISGMNTVSNQGIAFVIKAATGGSPNQGSASGSVAWHGTAAGIRQAVGHAAGTVALTGAAVGVALHAGTATGQVTYAGTAQGASVHQGTAAGSVAWAGTASGTAPVPGVNQGTATGHVAFTGTAAGSTTRSGTAAGQVAWAGTANGTAPVIAPNTGTAAGQITWAGVARGPSSYSPPAFLAYHDGAWVRCRAVAYHNGAWVEQPMKVYRSGAWVTAYDPALEDSLGTPPAVIP